MSRIRVTGDPPTELDREPLERARRRGDASTDGAAADRPVCGAPFVQVVLDRDGKVHPCPFTTRPLLRTPADTETATTPRLRDQWQSEPFRALRADMASGVLRRNLCRPCVHWIEARQPELAPLLEQDHPEPQQSTTNGAEPTLPQRIVLRFDRGEPMDAATWRQRLEALARSDQTWVLCAENLTDEPLWTATWELLHALPAAERPRIALETRCIADLEELRKRIGDIPVEHITLEVGTDWREQLRRARTLGPTTAMFRLDVENWFELVEVVAHCAKVGARARLSASDKRGRFRLAGLALDEQRIVQRWVESLWMHFTPENRPSSLDADEYNHFRHELRTSLREQVETASRSRNALEALRGTRRRLRFPPLDHPLLREREAALAFLDVWLHARDVPSLVAWVKRQVGNPRFVESARTRPWLRLLAQVVVRRMGSRRVRHLVRDWWLERRGVDAREEEQELGVGNETRARALRALHDELGAARVAPRKAAFVTPRPSFVRDAGGNAADDADVTILVPSYRHERYITECLRSALNQSHDRIRVLLVDDASPDGTVDMARRIEDPRLEVRSREQNLGLGNSVLTALEDVNTPYVALLNSDDVLHPERIERCRRVLESDARAELVATELALIDQDGGQIDGDNVSLVQDGRAIVDWVNWYGNARPAADSRTDPLSLLRCNWLATSSNLVCRTEFLKGQAEALAELRYCLDWHLFLVAARRGSLRVLERPLLGYRLHDSNTVWFDEARRWRYTLEVTRVALCALEPLLTELRSDAADAGSRARKLREVVETLHQNDELLGEAMWLEQAVGARAIQQLCEDDEIGASAALALERRARRDRVTRQALAPWDDRTLARNVWDLPTLPKLQVRALLEEVLEEDAAELHRRVDALESQRDDAVARRDDLRGRVRRRLADLAERLDLFESGLGEPNATLSELRAEGAAARTEAAIEDAFVVHLERVSRGAEHAHRKLEAERAARASTEESLANTRTELEEARSSQADAEAALTHERAAREQAEAGERQLREERDSLLRSREYRFGHIFWNRLPGTSATAGLLKGTAKRAANSWQRGSMLLDKWFRRRSSATGPVRIAAASTGQFPVLSHTFVYQELLSYHEAMGAEVKLFHQSNADRSELHAAFEYLDQNRTHVHSTWEQHTADFEHYRARVPERVESLMDALVEHGKLSREELEQNYEFRAAFTFTRRVEDWGADFVHTYFFYEQSLAGLVAQWILGLPRAVSAYADHMMDDHPLKVVALHVQTADVLVATSRRIKEELISKSSPEYADKIVVKPNGVDGRRFPFIERERVPAPPFRLVSVSRLEAKKGLIEMLEALAQLSDLEIELHVVGEGDPGAAGSEAYADRFRRRIAELGLEGRVVLHGKLTQDRVLPLLQQSHAFVAPYVETESGDKDGIPTAILEAIATGLPVIATDAGSIPEILDDDVEGLLVAQRDPTAFAIALRSVLEDRTVADRLGRAARARFEQEFDTAVTERRLHERVRAFLGRAVPSP